MKFGAVKLFVVLLDDLWCPPLDMQVGYLIIILLTVFRIA